MGRRKQRVRSPHPGVVLLPAKPEYRQRARARYRDPDTRKIRIESLPRDLDERSEQAVSQWLADKASWLVVRKLQLKQGAPRKQGTKLKESIDGYFKDSPARPGTLKAYRASADKLLDWAERNHIRSGDQLTLAKLRELRAYVRKISKHTAATGEGVGKGSKKASDRARSPHSVNKDLRQLAAVLEHLRKAGHVALLSRDAIRDGLERFRADVERPDFLRPPQCRALLAACLQHDAATYALTRAEARGEAKPGSTTRYEPIAPLVCVALLSGMRLGELLAVRWAAVDLDAGEIHLRASETKTRRDRTIDLSVSPALRELLEAMPRRGARVFMFARTYAESARRRLKASAEFEWHRLRRTTGTALANAPGIWAAASVFLTARQLGHSVQIAERHYLGRLKVASDVRSVEAALQIEGEIARVIEAVKAAG